MRHKGRRFYLCIFLWTLTLAWCVWSLALAAQPASLSAELSMGFGARLLKLFPFLSSSAEQMDGPLRKLAHAFVFFVQGALLFSALCATFKNHEKRQSAVAFGICFLLAALNEFRQLFAEGRSCEVRDILIDSAGALAGILLCLWLILFIKKRRSRGV